MAMSFEWNQDLIQDVYTNGGVLAYPTEAVWGLGCNPYNETAVQKLLDIKNRPMSKGVILVTGSVAHVEFLLKPLHSDLRQKALRFWPGHTTLLIPDIENQMPLSIRGEHDSVAVRVSLHPFICWFSDHVSPFLVSTSANVADEPPCRSYKDVQQTGLDVDYIVPGSTCGASQPSQIIQLTTGRVIRSL